LNFVQHEGLLVVTSLVFSCAIPLAHMNIWADICTSMFVGVLRPLFSHHELILKFGNCLASSMGFVMVGLDPRLGLFFPQSNFTGVNYGSDVFNRPVSESFHRLLQESDHNIFLILFKGFFTFLVFEKLRDIVSLDFT
jgi:hypothetical protein